MADIPTFISGLAGKTPKPPANAKVLEGFGGAAAIERAMGQRQGASPDAAAHKAFDKARTLYMPTIRVAQRIAAEGAKDLAARLADVEEDEAWDDWKAATTHLAEAYDLARGLIDAQHKAYAAARAAAMDTIGGALGMPEIGGGAVASSLAAADALARDGRWDEATARLKATTSDAAKVNARAPFVRACRRHQDTIKAAFAITHKGMGAIFKAEWEAALKTAESGAYESAARAVEALSTRVDKAKADPELRKARDAVARARNDNVEAMQQALAARETDVAVLRKLVLREIGGGREPALAAQATALGDDPGAKAREPLRDEASAEKLFMLSDWFALKGMLHEGQLSQERMWDCWRYRQQFVTKLIDALRKKYPTLVAKTSGSTDLESDIDITFASAEPGDDVKAASQFNALVKAKFGKPPGRVFDVNIYPRDYNAIGESINPDYNVDPIADRDIDQPTGAMQRLSRVDQDVATLLKQRRFLDDQSFQAQMDSVIAGVPDVAMQRRIRKQFEEGEDLFLWTAFEKVDRIKARLVGAKKALPPLALEFEALHDKGGKGDEASLERAQRLLPRVLDELEEAFAAEVMETTDEMYLEKMAKLREDQMRIAALDNVTAGPDAHHQGSCDVAHPGVEHEVWRQAEAERLKASVKKDQFINIVFANEAYMSQGAIEHVVAGIQAKDAAKKEAALARLTPATLMQSCNEQLADFFKDMKASAQEIAAETDSAKKRRATGEAFVHASKYLVRLLDAAQILADKFARFDPPVTLEFGLMKAAGVKTPKELMNRLEAVLLALRKSSTVPADAKGEVGVDEARALFGVDEIGAFRKLIADFGSELNQQVRRAPAFQAEMAVDRATERRYFGVTEMPEDLRAILGPATAMVAEPIGDMALEAAIGEAEGELELAQELLDAAKGPGRPPRHLADRIEDALLRAEPVMAALTGADVKAALAKEARIVRDGSPLLAELLAYDDDALHEAHKGDLAKARSDLHARIERAREIVADLEAELRQAVDSLDERLAALRSRVARAA